MILELALAVVLKAGCTPAAPEFPGEAPTCVEDAQIAPLVCGVNLDCSDVDRARAAQAKPAKKSGDSRTVRTSQSSNGASSTTITEKTPAGSSTVTTRRTAKGVTTTTRSTTVKK